MTEGACSSALPEDHEEPVSGELVEQPAGDQNAIRGKEMRLPTMLSPWACVGGRGKCRYLQLRRQHRLRFQSMQTDGSVIWFGSFDGGETVAGVGWGRLVVACSKWARAPEVLHPSAIVPSQMTEFASKKDPAEPSSETSRVFQTAPELSCRSCAGDWLL